jgi:hypothetical protein
VHGEMERYIGIAKQGPTFNGLLLAACNQAADAGDGCPSVAGFPSLVPRVMYSSCTEEFDLYRYC